MNYWLKSSATLHVGDNVVRLVIGNDFGKLYQSFVNKHCRLFTHSPAHGVHITLWNPKIHGVIPKEKADFLKTFYKNKKIDFEYDPSIIQGGQNKTFKNWYMRVKSMTAETICKYLGNDQYKHLHVTVCNTKGGERPYIWMK